MEIIIKYVLFLSAIITILTEMICHVNLIMCREAAYEYCLINANSRTRKRRSRQALLEYQKITFFTENNHRLSSKNADVSTVSKKNEQIIFHGFP